ncbi:MAG: HAMP domain-containing sensor histidine kinase [Bacteroidia bacterium]
MKLNRTYLFVAISSFALLIVLIIQLNWILQTAQMKEELFNEKANIVLSKTADALSTDHGNFKTSGISVNSDEEHKIDSLFNQFMKMYNIHIDYYFELKPISPPAGPNKIPVLTNASTEGIYFGKQQPESFQACIGPDDNKLELKLVFPGKEQFILAEMGIPFIASVMLIIVVIVMFWRTVTSLMKEKRISEHTTDFLNNMTHEFKTPLTNIGLAGKMIIKDAAAGKEDKITHYSSIILEENEKLRLQVEQVLSMTALERGEIPLHKTEFDFHALINEALRSISIQVENKQGNVSVLEDAKRFLVSGDRTHLANVLCNIFENALKYSKEAPELFMHTSNDERNLILTITDKGIGIEKQYQKKVFDKFFRVPTGDVHDVKGFGLGLSYVKRIIELHEGIIDLRSEAGAGTTFTIRIPYV